MDDILCRLVSRYITSIPVALPVALCNQRNYAAFTSNINDMRSGMSMFMNKAYLQAQLQRATDVNVIVALSDTLSDNTFCRYCQLIQDNCCCCEPAFNYLTADASGCNEDWAKSINAKLLMQ